MYKDRVDAIKKRGVLRMLVIPLLLGILAMCIVMPFVITLLIFLAFGYYQVLISPLELLGYVCSLVVSVLLAKLVTRLKLRDFGLGKRGALRKSLLGAGLGFGAITLVAIFVNLLGGVTTSFVAKPEFIGSMLLALVLFSFQSMYEEFVFRGYLMPHFSKLMGDFWSLILTSVLFAAVHALNPGMAAVPVINLILAGLVFGLVYYLWGSLWIAGFAHALWNFSQGVIYGSEVSGMRLPKTVLQATPVEGMDLISGTSFGFEGSLVTTVLGVCLTVLAVVAAKKKGIPIRLKKTAEVPEAANGQASQLS